MKFFQGFNDEVVGADSCLSKPKTQGNPTFIIRFAKKDKNQLSVQRGLLCRIPKVEEVKYILEVSVILIQESTVVRL